MTGLDWIGFDWTGFKLRGSVDWNVLCNWYGLGFCGFDGAGIAWTRLDWAVLDGLD